MPAPWINRIRLISEARPASAFKNDIIRYVTVRYGQHEADEVMSLMQKEPFPEFRRKLHLRFMDPKIDSAVDGMARASHIDPESGDEVQRRGPGRPPKAQAAQGPSGRQFVDPAQARSQQAATAATAAMRPDRAGSTANVPAHAPTPARPGERPTQAVGTAGQHPTKAQPSVQVRPQGISQELQALRARLAKLPPEGHSPESDQQRAELQAKIDQTAQGGEEAGGEKEKVRALQRKVDYITQTYGKEKGDRFAKHYGVPTTAERTTTDTEGKTRVQVWDANRVTKFMQRDDVIGSRIPNRAQDLPKAGPKAQGGGPHKPMTRVTDPQTGKVSLQVRPGQFVGQRWRPSGIAKKQATARPDQATGNFAYGSRFTDPSQEGQEVVWDGKDWILPSEFAAKFGQRRAGDSDI